MRLIYKKWSNLLLFWWPHTQKRNKRKHVRSIHSCPTHSTPVEIALKKSVVICFIWCTYTEVSNGKQEPWTKLQKAKKPKHKCDAIHSIILFVFNDETSNVKGVKKGIWNFWKKTQWLSEMSQPKKSSGNREYICITLRAMHTVWI